MRRGKRGRKQILRRLRRALNLRKPFNSARKSLCKSLCGGRFRTAERAVKAPKEKKDTRRLLVRILDICRASLILVFSLVMFIMSFMSVSRVSAPGDILSDLDMNGIEIISVDVSSLDLIQGAFLRHRSRIGGGYRQKLRFVCV